MEIREASQAAPVAQSRGTQALSQLGEDYTTFLTLLTAQVSNQDPLEPIDSTTFVTQLAQLTQVEQAAQSNIQLETLGAKLDAMALMSSSALLGQKVRFPTETLVLNDSGAQVGYKLSKDAASVRAEIISPSGVLIRTLEGLPSNSSQDQVLAWNGRSDAGQDALRGNYTVRILADDARGQPIETEVFREAAIEEVQLVSGEISYLVDGGEYIPSESVLAVKF